mmetsp:Transcript_23968/g.69319  ORF Transcript_23968/g.69319 Transcript_23968/m.69319 type:complete len:223 (+) Transcript_23968:81-749(+)
MARSCRPWRRTARSWVPRRRWLREGCLLQLTRPPALEHHHRRPTLAPRRRRPREIRPRARQRVTLLRRRTAVTAAAGQPRRMAKPGTNAGLAPGAVRALSGVQGPDAVLDRGVPEGGDRGLTGDGPVRAPAEAAAVAAAGAVGARGHAGVAMTAAAVVALPRAGVRARGEGTVEMAIAAMATGATVTGEATTAAAGTARKRRSPVRRSRVTPAPNVTVNRHG